VAKTFKQLKEDLNKVEFNTAEYQAAMIKLSYVLEHSDTLNENVEYVAEAVNDTLKKFGLHVAKGKGLISYFAKFATGAGKLIIAALKGDGEAVAEISNSVKKEDVIDFLLKLDQATLHLVTGPIHMIDAITGWHIAANIKHAAETASNIMDKIKKAYVDLKTIAAQAFKSTPAKLKAINDLEPIIVNS
jgi:hypothetical protein